MALTSKNTSQYYTSSKNKIVQHFMQVSQELGWSEAEQAAILLRLLELFTTPGVLGPKNERIIKASYQDTIARAIVTYESMAGHLFGVSSLDEFCQKLAEEKSEPDAKQP